MSNGRLRILVSDAARSRLISLKVKGKIPRPPHLTLLSQSQPRVSKVRQVWLTRWQSSGNYLDGYMASAGAADSVNKSILDGEVLPNSCQCSVEESLLRLHDCDGCGHSVPCSKLHPHPIHALRICASCLEGLPTTGSRGKWRMERLLGSMAQTECMASYSPDYASCYAMLYDDLQESEWFRDWDHYIDAYSRNKIRTLENDSGPSGIALRRHPFNPSIDAVRPYAITPHGLTGLHCPGNIAPTAAYLNYGAATFVKRCLPAISCFSRHPTRARKLRCIEDMRAVHRIAISLPFARRGRIGQDVNHAEYRRLEEKWRTLSFTEEDVPKKAKGRLYKYIARARIRGAWRPDEFDRIQGVITSIVEHWTEVRGQVITLPESDDGCPWPFDEDVMPRDWSWASAWRWMADRLETYGSPSYMYESC